MPCGLHATLKKSLNVSTEEVDALTIETIGINYVKTCWLFYTNLSITESVRNFLACVKQPTCTMYSITQV